MKETLSPLVTLETLNSILSAMEERMTKRMMQGFEAMDIKIDFVEAKIHQAALDSERRDKTLSARIQQLAFTKADWPEAA